MCLGKVQGSNQDLKKKFFLVVDQAADEGQGICCKTL